MAMAMAMASENVMIAAVQQHLTDEFPHLSARQIGDIASRVHGGHSTRHRPGLRPTTRRKTDTHPSRHNHTHQRTPFTHRRNRRPTATCAAELASGPKIGGICEKPTTTHRLPFRLA
jgi:hypothetical protein